jgi:hypothetical protein
VHGACEYWDVPPSIRRAGHVIWVSSELREVLEKDKGQSGGIDRGLLRRALNNKPNVSSAMAELVLTTCSPWSA